MILKQVNLKNIRSHETTSINFNNGVTVLSGRTGCGKSSIFMSINYALFGADVNLNNNAILRRGAKQGHVHLVFNHNGVEYEVMRGMKRSGNRIIINPDQLWIKKEGVKLSIISRTNEVNEKILEILNYPIDVKPRDLFEITSYAKQDEIRKLIELSNSEREKYIDRVLQLSKYELTYNNIKPLINNLGNELSRLKGLIQGLDGVAEEIECKKKELKNLEENELVIKKELSDSELTVKGLEAKHEKLKKELAMLEAEKSSHDKKKGLLDEFTKDLEQLTNDLSNLKDPGKSKLDECQAELVKLTSEQNTINHQLKESRVELKNLSELRGDCPLCKQQISESHVSKVKGLYEQKIKELNDKNELINEQLIKVKEGVVQEKDKKELINSIKVKKERLKELKEKIDYLKDELKRFKGLKQLDGMKKEYDELNQDYINASSDLARLKEKNDNLTINLDRLKNELIKNEKELSILESSKEKAGSLSKKISLIKRLRDDIRSIRGVVRQRFLEDFRHEFQQKYEDIRKDDDYSVEINNNYQPLCFAGREETSINALSGGEKTSVALAYRLALSGIASRVSSVDNNELLLLDEPTTGFDRRDISALPQALRAIKSIPQIIIVSHEDELKEAADVNYELMKRNEVTSIIE